MVRSVEAYRQNVGLKKVLKQLLERHGGEPQICEELKQAYIAVTAGGEDQTDFKAAMDELTQIGSRGKTRPRQLSLKGFWGRGK